MENTFVNSIDNLNTDLIVLSYVRKSINPRFIIHNKLYPIIISLPESTCVFGVDRVYDKSYIKLKIPSDSIINKLIDIEDRLRNLVYEREHLELATCFCGKNTMALVLDKNISVNDNKSVFGLNAGTVITCEITLGSIYIHNNIAKYKWIVNNLSFV
jgi:hypothetical protein